MIRVKIPAPLQRLTGGHAEVPAEGNTVMDIVDSLDGKFPGFKDRLTENGQLRRFVLVYVNGEDIRFGKEGATPLKDGDEVSIVPAIAGG